jgi:hypothetical protein
MKRAVKVLAVVDALLVVTIVALLMFDEAAMQRFARLVGLSEEVSAVVPGQGDDGDESDRAGSATDVAGKGKKGAATKLDKAALEAMLKAGRVDETEVDRRVAEIVAMKKHTVEVKRVEEERRIGEVADWFDRLMAAHPESGQKAREILNEYIDLRYATYGDMEDVDPEFARAQRESVRQHVGQRLLSELPPAQGATILKRLFI